MLGGGEVLGPDTGIGAVEGQAAAGYQVDGDGGFAVLWCFFGGGRGDDVPPTPLVPPTDHHPHHHRPANTRKRQQH